MANPTSNFGWVMPTSTDLVTDLPADFAVFGQAVDTSMADLKGGTTGQVLSKASNTDMDFTWVTDAGDIAGVTAGTGITGGGTSGTVTITNDMATTITASGDIVVGTGSGTYDNLPIGTTGQVLTADTTVSPYKVKWASASAAKNFTLVNAGGTALSGTTTTVSGISGADELLILVIGASLNTGGGTSVIRINSDTTSANYANGGGFIDGKATYNANFVGNISELSQGGYFRVFQFSNDATSVASLAMHISGCNSAGAKIMDSSASASYASSNGQYQINTGGVYLGTSTVSSIDLVSLTGGYTFDAGTIYVYKSA